MPASTPTSRTDRSAGFTLVELLVVIVILGILASIAIPVFLNQRANAYRDALRSDVKNASTAAESFATGASGGTYAGLTTAALDAQRGPARTTGVTVTVVRSGVTGFCLKGVNADLPDEPLFYDSSAGRQSGVDCSSSRY